MRPHYPGALFDDLSLITGMTDDGEVLEIGCGPGIASVDLLGRGWRVLAVEPGASMAELARRAAGALPFEVVASTFEAWDPAGRQFALVFSATAFHWVDPAIRWKKTASVLIDGGHLALATNRTVSGSTFEDLYTATAHLHARYAVGVDEGPSPTEEELRGGLLAAPPDIGVLWGVADPKGGDAAAGELFEPPVVRSFAWEQSYTAEEAVTLLSTYSPYLAVPEGQRMLLLRGIREILDERFGGSVTRRYLSILAVARRARLR